MDGVILFDDKVIMLPINLELVQLFGHLGFQHLICIHAPIHSQLMLEIVCQDHGWRRSKSELFLLLQWSRQNITHSVCRTVVRLTRLEVFQQFRSFGRELRLQCAVLSRLGGHGGP